MILEHARPCQLDFGGLTGHGLRLGSFNKETQPLIAVHGWLDNLGSFIPLMHSNPTWPWLSIDLIGHGQSAWRASSSYYYFFDYLCDFVSLIERDYPQGVHLIGHSLGAAIVSVLAGIVPELVKSVVLLDGLGPLTHDVSAVAAQLRLSLYQHKHPRPRRYYAEKKLMSLARQKKHTISLSACDLLIEHGFSKDDKGYTWSFDPKLFHLSPMQMTQEQVLSLLSAVQAPVLLIKALEGYPFEETLMNEHIAMLRHFTQNNIHGAHHVHMDKPEEVSQLIQRFYAQHALFSSLS